MSTAEMESIAQQCHIPQSDVADFLKLINNGRIDND